MVHNGRLEEHSNALAADLALQLRAGGDGGRREMEDEVEMPWKTPSVAGT